MDGGAGEGEVVLPAAAEGGEERAKGGSFEGGGGGGGRGVRRNACEGEGESNAGVGEDGGWTRHSVIPSRGLNSFLTFILIYF